MKSYFKEKSDAYSGKKEGSEEARKNLLPNFYVNNNFFESVFGGNTIEVIPQGSVAMDLGLFGKRMIIRHFPLETVPTYLLILINV